VEETLDVLFKKSLEGDLEANYKIRDLYNGGEYLREIYEFARENAEGNDFAKYHYAKFFAYKNDFCEMDKVREAKMFGEIAGRGNSFGQFAMGIRSLKTDPLGACDYYKLSAGQNNRLAQEELGEIYYWRNGNGAGVDKKEGYRWMFLAGRNGLVSAKILLGKMYLDESEEVKIDCDLVLAWIVELGRGGNMKAVDLLWLYMVKKKSVSVGLICECLNLGDERNSRGCYYLGKLYLSDEFGMKSYEKAIGLIDRLKKVDDVGVLFQIGYDYSDSKDMRVLEMAVDCLLYCLKVDGNDGNAMGMLGWIYFDSGLLHNYGTAVYWFQQGAAENNGMSLYNLGLAFLNGFCVEKNVEIAFDYFRKSSLVGFSDGVRQIGRMCRDGVGVEVNLVESFNHFASPLLLDDEEGQIDLAMMYSYGRGCVKNVRRAIEIVSKLSLDSAEVKACLMDINEREGETIMIDYVKEIRKEAI